MNLPYLNPDPSTQKIHFLKTWTEHFDAVWFGVKRFELRQNDRSYQVGDVLLLQDYDNHQHTFSGRMIACYVEHMIQGPSFGLEEGYCIMSITVRERSNSQNPKQ